MNIVICEDNAEDLRALRKIIESYFKQISCPVEIKGYGNGDDFLADLDAGEIKGAMIAFLDIYMPGASGIDVAKEIRKTDKDMVIIFTTTSLQHGLDGYSVYAMQYLIKPLETAQVEEVLKRCVELFAQSLRYVEVFVDRLTVKVYLKDIMYIEVFNATLHIHTTTEVIRTQLPLSELEKRLDDSMFLRTYRSFIVNMSYIGDISADYFIMKNGVEIPIRRDNKREIKQTYRDYLFNHMGRI